MQHYYLQVYTYNKLHSVDVRVWYEQATYTISEQEDNVELCVTSISSGIEEMFTINITTDSFESMYFLHTNSVVIRSFSNRFNSFNAK